MLYEIEYISGMYPTQAEGTIGNKKFYFRYRHNKYRLQVHSTDAIGNFDVRFFGETDANYDSGYMPTETVLDLIEHCALLVLCGVTTGEHQIDFYNIVN